MRFNITWHNVFSFTINRMNFFGSIRKFMTHINNAVLINPNVFSAIVLHMDLRREHSVKGALEAALSLQHQPVP